MSRNGSIKHVMSCNVFLFSNYIFIKFRFSSEHIFIFIEKTGIYFLISNISGFEVKVDELDQLVKHIQPVQAQQCTAQAYVFS